jgi:hypothetical protein
MRHFVLLLLSACGGGLNVDPNDASPDSPDVVTVDVLDAGAAQQDEGAPDTGVDATPSVCPGSDAGFITNGSFEDQGPLCGAPWTSSDAQLQRDSLARCGSSSCRVCGTGMFEIASARKMSPTPGIYHLHAWLHAAPNAEVPFHCWGSINIYGGNGLQAGNGSSLDIVPSNVWTKLDVVYNVPQGFGFLDYKIYCEAVGAENDCVLVDDLTDETP